MGKTIGLAGALDAGTSGFDACDETR